MNELIVDPGPLARLRHYTADPDIIVPFTVEQSVEHKLYMVGKPNGLWVSVKGDDDWPTWCRDNDYNLDGIAHEHAVRLTRHARIMHLSNSKDILFFHRIYGQDSGLMAGYAVDWIRMQREGWQGILIAPYCWNCRMELGWYYGWDCASGCIWDAEAIESITLMENA